MKSTASAKISTPLRSPASSKAYLEVNKVQKLYSQGTVAIGEVSVAIPRGQFVSIVGPSGCGKSTLLKIIAGLLPASAGEVILEDEPAGKSNQKMIYVFQQFMKSILPWKTVLENTQFGLKYRSSEPVGAQLEACRQMLRRVGLAGRENMYPYQLSGGMQQRVALARALVCRPNVLLLDEPCSNVDAITRSDLQDLILSIWSEFGLTILNVTHDLDEALYLSQRVIVLSQAPSGVVRDLTVDLPYPRDQVTTRSQTRYLQYREELFDLLRGRAK